MVDAFYAEVNTAIAENRDPLLVIPEFSDATFIAWDDDQPNSFNGVIQRHDSGGRQLSAFCDQHAVARDVR